MPSDLQSFDLSETLRCGRGIRAAASEATTLEDAMNGICRFLFDELVDASGERACALIRCYKTHRYEKLEPDQRIFAAGLMAGETPDPDMKCLTLMATVGVEQKWNHRRKSSGHRAIPLPRREIVEKAPMIAQLIKQFGLDISMVVRRPSREVVQDLEGRTYGVFHVEHALGSPYIPAQQDFVVPYGIRSVVGCGGSLRGADLFALILFTTMQVPSSVAERFRTLALDMKSALFQFDEDKVFARRRKAPA
jgi:hypothetical protein